MKSKVFVFSLLLLAALVLACGVAPMPAPAATATTAPATKAAIALSATATAAPVTKPSVAASTLAPQPTASNLPGPRVALNRTFRYGPLNVTIVDRQLVGQKTPEGETCLSTSQTNLALRLKIANTVARPVESTLRIFLTDATGQQLDKIAPAFGMFFAPGGVNAALKLDSKATVEQTMCTSFRNAGDPNAAYLTIGENDEERVRVPLAEQGPAALGVYVELPLNQAITFKTADLKFTQVILASGVWNPFGNGLPKTGKLWLQILTSIKNNGKAMLFIEKGEFVLEVNGQELAPEFNATKEYTIFQSGLGAGLSAQGSLLFAIPADAKEAVLHARPRGTKDDMQVKITLPAH